MSVGHHPLGLELLTVLGMGPVEHVTLAADLGCRAISTGVTQLPFNPYGYPSWSLVTDPALRRAMITAMHDLDVEIAIGEGFRARTDTDVRDLLPQLDLMAELGARAINAVNMDCPMPRGVEQLGTLRELAAERGMGFSIEFVVGSMIADLATAADVARQIGGQVLVDTMHFFRSGGTVAEIAALDPALIGHVQISDVPRVGPGDYMQEAMFARMIPGTGELPLREFVAALPDGVTIGIEVPNLALAQSGRSARDVVSEIVAATRAITG